jgi:hypothetical protein
MYRGWFVWRNNSGIIRTQKGSFVKMGMAGLPDLFAVKDGHLLGVEVKRPGKHPSSVQERMLAELRDHGAYTIVVSSIDELEKSLKLIPPYEK